MKEYKLFQVVTKEYKYDADGGNESGAGIEKRYTFDRWDITA